MIENIRSTNLRFNLEKDTQKRAWQYLQTMDKQQFKSYSNVIAVALVEYFDRYYRSQDDPYFETREREERFVNQIISSVESAIPVWKKKTAISTSALRSLRRSSVRPYAP